MSEEWADSVTALAADLVRAYSVGYHSHHWNKESSVAVGVLSVYERALCDFLEACENLDPPEAYEKLSRKWTED